MLTFVHFLFTNSHNVQVFITISVQCADFLAKGNVNALAYHAGLTDIQRCHTQKKWIDDEVQVQSLFWNVLCSFL